MEITKPGRESHVPHIQILMNTERRFEHSLDNTAYNNNNKSKTKPNLKTSLKKKEVKTSNSPPAPAIHRVLQSNTGNGLLRQ